MGDPSTAAEPARALGRALFGEGVAFAVGDPAAPPEGLLPEEREGTGTMVDKRLREFAAGRRCAHRALLELGWGTAFVARGEDRAPLWPEGITGSITHTEGWCAAVVAPRASHVALGLDAEPAAPLDPSLWPAVLGTDERAWLATRPSALRGHLARLLFAAKEAVHKCQYPLTGHLLDFDEVSVQVDEPRRALSARFRGRAVRGWPRGDVPGRFVRAGGLLVASAFIQAAGGPR
jgi:4'-phosphopantetheinyl transferase EntD